MASYDQSCSLKDNGGGGGVVEEGGKEQGSIYAIRAEGALSPSLVTVI